MPAPSTTPGAGPAADSDHLTIARAAGEQVAQLLPSTVPLQVVDATTLPGDDAVLVRASFVGAVSAELLLVADTAVAEALAAAGGTVSLADALRPALEAASAALGPGVLDVAQTSALDGALDDGAVTTVALAGDDGVVQAWFGLRLRPRPDTVPQPRSGGPAGVARPAEDRSALRLLHDVEMTLTAEIGRTKLPVRQVLELVPGTVLELDRAAGAPADVMVNGRLVARGEVVVVDEEYGIRITEIVASDGV